jgi:hypothetical protein
MPEPIATLREKLAAHEAAQKSDGNTVDAWLEYADACAEHVPAILALPYHLGADALIAVDGFRGSEKFPGASAYPPKDGGAWMGYRVGVGVYEEAALPDYVAAVAKLREWGCTRIVLQLRVELPAEEGGQQS